MKFLIKHNTIILSVVFGIIGFTIFFYLIDFADLYYRIGFSFILGSYTSIMISMMMQIYYLKKLSRLIRKKKHETIE